MSVYDRQLKITDIYEGTLIYAVTDGRFRIRLNWKKPLEEILYMEEGGDLLIYRPRLNQVLKGQAQKTPVARSALYLLLMKKTALLARYRIAVAGHENISPLSGAWHLQLNTDQKDELALPTSGSNTDRSFK